MRFNSCEGDGGVISLVGFSHSGEKKTSRMVKIYISKLLPTSQPSEDARLARQQHYRAGRRWKKARVFVR